MVIFPTGELCLEIICNPRKSSRPHWTLTNLSQAGKKTAGRWEEGLIYHLLWLPSRRKNLEINPRVTADILEISWDLQVISTQQKWLCLVWLSNDLKSTNEGRGWRMNVLLECSPEEAHLNGKKHFFCASQAAYEAILAWAPRVDGEAEEIPSGDSSGLCDTSCPSLFETVS